MIFMDVDIDTERKERNMEKELDIIRENIREAVDKVGYEEVVRIALEWDTYRAEEYNSHLRLSGDY